MFFIIARKLFDNASNIHVHNATDSPNCHSTSCQNKTETHVARNSSNKNHTSNKLSNLHDRPSHLSIFPQTLLSRNSTLKNRSIIQTRSERRGREAICTRLRGLNPVLRDPEAGRPITQVVELRERTRRHRISAEIAERQIGRTIYSHVSGKIARSGIGVVLSCFRRTRI